MAASITDKFTKSYSLLSKSLSSGINNTDTTIPLNNVTNIPTDTAVHFIIDRVDSNGNSTPTTRELCKGVVSGGNLINCTRGLHGTTAQSHLSGAVVEFTTSAVGLNEMVDGLIAEHNQDGTHSTTLVTARTEDTAPDGSADYVLTYDNSATALKKVKPDNLVRNNTQLTTGWLTGVLPAVSSVTANGNRSHDVTFASTVASYLTPGQRIRITRTVAAPTQCTSLNGTTQYWVKTSPNKLTFTNNFVVSAWVKLSSYAAGTICSRYSGGNGWSLDVTPSGLVRLSGYSGGAGNYAQSSSYQSLPLNKWVHVAAQLDMSTTSAGGTNNYIMFDGVEVPSFVVRAGTNPVTLTQAGNLEIGSAAAGTFFPGKIAQVAIYNAKVTQANILATISQGLTGSETSLASAYSFNNSTTDLNTSTPNDLSAGAGSPTATNADSPFGGQADGTISSTLDYAVVRNVSTTVATVQVPEGNTIPTTGGVTSVDMSAWESPYNMPQIGNILGQVILNSQATVASAGATDINMTTTVYVPTNRKVRLTFNARYMSTSGVGATGMDLYMVDSTSSTTLMQNTASAPNANYAVNACFSSQPLVPPASGSRTYKMQASTASGTLTIPASSTYPIVFTVELV